MSRVSTRECSPRLWCQVCTTGAGVFAAEAPALGLTRTAWYRHALAINLAWTRGSSDVWRHDVHHFDAAPQEEELEDDVEKCRTCMKERKAAKVT